MADDPRQVVVVSGADELKKLLGSATPPAAPPEERRSVTEHEVVIDGARVPYRAEAGTMPVALEDRKKAKGRMFYVSYVRTDAPDPSRRPVTFCFNGGPGSSSVWLHLGVFGPQRVALDVGAVPPPGATAADNPASLLDVTDLVFVDPIATGWSKADSPDGSAPYHGVQGDVESVAEFVRRWVTRHNRWSSPKYVAGESYGTTRAAALARKLLERHGLYLNGLVLLSVALKFQTLKFDEGNDLPYVLYVPGYAATAAYHGRREVADLEEHLRQAEAWAFDRYMPALLRGASLPAAERERIGRELAGWIGLTPEFVARCDNRVSLSRFCRELLREQRRTVGRLDARFLGLPKDAAGEHLEDDPSLSALFGAYTSAFHHHLRTRLAYDEEETYEILSLDVHRAWTWEGANNQYLDVSGHLRHALAENAHLRVFVASGQYDLATPPAATAYTLNQLALRERPEAVVHRVYPAGHMMYIHEPSLQALRRDLVAFYG